MDPYESPEASSEELRLDDPTTHRSYDAILKMVLWDEPREKIDQKMRVNKIAPVVAEQIYQHARADRISTIRKEYLKKALMGFLVVLVTSGALLWFTIGATGSGYNVLFVWYVPLAWGLWKLVDGTVGFFMAEKKTGSVADEI